MGSVGRPPTGWVCDHCGEPGHYKPTCPKRRRPPPIMPKLGEHNLESHRWARLATGRRSAELRCLDCDDVLVWSPVERDEPDASHVRQCPKAKPPTLAPTLTNGTARARETSLERYHREKAQRDDRRKA